MPDFDFRISRIGLFLLAALGLPLALTACSDRLAPPEPIAAQAVQRGDEVIPVGSVAGDPAAMQPIRLVAMQFAMPRGSELGHLDYNPLICWPSARFGPFYWDSDRIDAAEKDWPDGFFRVLGGHGYNVVGDPDRLFPERGAQRPVYQVAANVKQAHIEASASCNLFTGFMTGVNATATISVEWQVFEPLQRRVVWRGETRGEYKSKSPLPPGSIVQALAQAFADASNNLAVIRPFRDAVMVAPQRPEALVAEADTLILPLVPPNATAFADRTDAARSATVLINSGTGHGSGFLISSQGHVVTNWHVVGEQRFVAVHLVSGRRVVGEVLRTASARDVALVKIEGEGYVPLALRREPVMVAEEVYAIGAPQRQELGWTVTRGIVSAYRQAMRNSSDAELDLIQSDVPIHGGNSGGPLLDKQGNLVGIAVQTMLPVPGKLNTGLNGFIPILDGLKHLKVEFRPAAEIRRRLSDGTIRAE